MSLRGMVAGLALSTPIFVCALSVPGTAPAEPLELTDGVIIIESNNRKSIIILPASAFDPPVVPLVEPAGEGPPATVGAAGSPITLVSEPAPATGAPDSDIKAMAEPPPEAGSGGIGQAPLGDPGADVLQNTGGTAPPR